ncbi:tetraacyldisaccharide 4'-kinase [Lebetimonas natsushimae]|uniref:Tetraacyldisaccharide 4'-kinase n=1 Tax=Lebetimonas natsushimae TaxID=1936991 RepID=A0A292YFQ0_9BACT|nr:tetraacyldisaccharide 4'-kinase [Lebetimonas natsushimae]GAX87961.1 tetraacyldisaccharide 4'-kinase [Lebetimonas natsushimae]
MKNGEIKEKIFRFFEEMYYSPKWYHYPVILALLPFSFIYLIIAHFKFPRNYEDMKIPIISIGNIITGGSGKTPLAIAIAKHLKDKKIAVVLRGYKRLSQGLVVVKDFNEILVPVEISGDEAMEIALSSNAAVIVSEDRKKGIEKAKELGCEVVILDDGFDKPFKKLNIVIDKKLKNPFVLPAGGYRYPRLALRFADIILRENVDFKRNVKKTKGDVLISAISNPKRLLKYADVKEYKFFPDHYFFKKKDIKAYRNKTIVTTEKDYVKLKQFGLNLKVIEMDLEINKEILDKIDEYVKIS